ncbi:MAG: thiamine pyrophosphate-dependent enzyme [Alphaproteobacteria bacterium]
MKRFEAMKAVMAAVKDEPVVVTLGHSAQELYQIGDRPQNFYMLGSMGLATSIAHGIALSRPGKVVALDGDSAVTMNMGELATIGFNLTPNLVVVIIDNEANGATGFQPSMTGKRLKLDEVARGCGIQNVSVVNNEAEVTEQMTKALADKNGPYVIVVKAEVGIAPGIEILPFTSEQIRDRFKQAIAADSAA